jgi:hypothetical protein
LGSSTFSVAFLVAASVAAAQDIPAPTDTGLVLKGPQRVSGQVMRPGTTEMIPVPRVWVTLHRVGNDTASPLDSVRSDDSGRYEFRFTRTGDEQAVYFVSANYGGIAYFTPPLMHSTVVGPEAEIAVFDTTSAHVPISTRGHHVIVSAADANSIRRVTEVFELANDSSVTRVARAGPSGAAWSTAYPAKASLFEVSQGDVPAAAVKFENGRANVYAPLAPGIKQIAFSYALPAASFPLRFQVTRETQVLEVLIEEEKGSVTGAKLKEVDPVSVERRSFRRFLASDVPANEVSVIDLPVTGAARRVDPKIIAALTLTIGGAMAFVLARSLRQR